MKKNFEIKITNEIDQLELVEEKIDLFSSTINLPEEVRQKVSIALDELLNNVITHGYLDDEQHFIVIKMDLQDSKFIIIIIDDGQAFDPTKKDSPDTTSGIEEREIGGLGIHMVRNLMDEFTYDRIDSKNIVTLGIYI